MRKLAVYSIQTLQILTYAMGKNVNRWNNARVHAVSEQLKATTWLVSASTSHLNHVSNFQMAAHASMTTSARASLVMITNVLKTSQTRQFCSLGWVSFSSSYYR